MTPVTKNGRAHSKTAAARNRDEMRRAGVFAVNVIGGPGCGKTSLIDATIGRLMPEVHIGVVACDVSSHLDADRLQRHSDQVVQVNAGITGIIRPPQILEALQWLDLHALDMLFIENVGTLVQPTDADLGQDAAAAVFSVAAGDDKAEKHADIVRAADVIVLNKVDLLPSVPFNLGRFRSDVKRLNPVARLIELSALRGDGVDDWIDWLKRPSKPALCRASAWFG